MSYMTWSCPFSTKDNIHIILYIGSQFNPHCPYFSLLILKCEKQFLYPGSLLQKIAKRMEDKQWVVSCLLGFDAVPPQHLTIMLPSKRQADNRVHQEYLCKLHREHSRQQQPHPPSDSLPLHSLFLASSR